jgi:hypothetical protein
MKNLVNVKARKKPSKTKQKKIAKVKMRFARYKEILTGT